MKRCSTITTIATIAALMLIGCRPHNTDYDRGDDPPDDRRPIDPQEHSHGCQHDPAFETIDLPEDDELHPGGNPAPN